MKTLLLLLLPTALLSQEHTCSPGKVEWLDAMSFSRSGLPADDLTQMLAPSITIGCVGVQEKAVIVITMFQQGRPTDWVVIPAPWITRITALKEGIEVNATPNNPTAKVLPQVQDQNLARVPAPNGRNRRFRDNLSHLWGK